MQLYLADSLRAPRSLSVVCLMSSKLFSLGSQVCNSGGARVSGARGANVIFVAPPLAGTVEPPSFGAPPSGARGQLPLTPSRRHCTMVIEKKIFCRIQKCQMTLASDANDVIRIRKRLKSPYGNSRITRTAEQHRRETRNMFEKDILLVTLE
jgi:hypothetical protein